ncbi:glycosyltransferase family 87 protein [Pseudomyxococcus flavus]
MTAADPGPSRPASPPPAASERGAPADGSWDRWAWWLVLLGLAIAAVAVGQHPRRGVDFRVYLMAAERFLEGTDIYRLSDGTMPFKYAPITAPLFLPFTLLPARAAVALWNLGSIAALAVAARLTMRAAPGPGEATPWRWAPVVTTLALLPAFTFELFYGQVDAVILLLILVSTLGAERGQVWRPGAAFAVAFLLKPPAALVGLFFLWRRHWRVIGATAVVGIALTLPTLVRYGVDGTLIQFQLWSDTLARTTPPWALQSNPQGLPTLLLSLVYPPGAVVAPGAISLAQAVALALFVAAVAWARPGPADFVAVCCLGVTLLSPLAWRANFVLAWPLIRAAVESRHRPNLALVGLIALTGILVSDSVLGLEASRHVLLWRPFAIVYTALLVVLLAQMRRVGAPRAMVEDNAVARLPRCFTGGLAP